MCIAAEHSQLHVVAAVERLRVQPGHGAGLRGIEHLHMALIAVTLREHIAQRPGRQRTVQHGCVQRDRQRDALPEAAIRRHEERSTLQAGMFPDLGHVFVLQVQAIGLERQGRCRARAFVRGDALASAPGVAGHGMDAQRRVAAQAPGLHQRAQQRNGAGRITTRVADPQRAGDARILAGRHFGKAVYPVRMGAVCRGRVDDPHPRIADAGHGLSRCRVGQAQHHHVAIVGSLRTRGGVLAQAVRQGNEVDVRAPGQPLPDLQAGGALVAVDEYAEAHVDVPVVKREACGLAQDW